MRRVLAAMAATALMLCVGCTKVAEEPRPVPPRESGVAGSSTLATPTPGVSRLESEDSITAVGTLVYDRKSDSFILIDADADAPLTGKERVLAQVDSGDDASQDLDLVSLIGAYVELHGKSCETTVTVAYPCIAIDSMRIITLPGDK